MVLSPLFPSNERREMKNTFLWRKSLANIIFSFLMLSVSGSVVFSQTQRLDLRFLLEKQPVMIGEPIILNFKLRNQCAVAVNADMEGRKTAWLRITILDEKDAALPEITNRFPKTSDGTHYEWYIESVAPGDSVAGQVIVSRLIAVTKPGRYRMRIQATVPYYAGGRELIPSIELGKAKPLGVFEDEQTFSLTVTKPDDAPLRRIAEIYRRKILDGSNVTNRWNAIKALFSMPEAVALPAWKSLLTEWPDNTTIEELTRLGTPAATELLAEIAANPKWNEEVHEIAKSKLRMMYFCRKQIANSTPEPALAKILLRLDGKLPN